MKQLKFCLLFLITVSLTGSALAFTPSKELNESIVTAIPKAQSVQGNILIFQQLTKPMAPLDLNFKKPINDTDASNQSNYFYGVMGGAAGFKGDEINGLVSTFFKRYQPDSLPSGLIAKASAASELVIRFKQLPKITRVATWKKDSFRVNDIFIEDEKATIYHCTGSYLPCPEKTTQQVSKLKAENAKLVEEAKPLVEEMQRIGLVAIVKTDSGTRAIIDGMADNEVGFYMLTQGGVLPKEFEAGQDVIFSGYIKSNIYFYVAR